MDRAVQVAERNVEHYVGKAEKKIQGLADKAEFHISQYDRPPKKGSGDRIRRRETVSSHNSLNPRNGHKPSQDRAGTTPSSLCEQKNRQGCLLGQVQASCSGVQAFRRQR